MSKTRTGRKGRARLAMAGHLNAIGGTRTSLDADNEATLLEKLQALATGQGTSGAQFLHQEVIGAIPDSECSGSGIFEANETAGGNPLAANVAGEASLAASGDLPQLQAAFTHHYITKQGTVLNASIAKSKEAGTLATTTSGIAYLPSGPGAKFIPANHGLAQNDILTFAVTPDFDAVKKSSYTKMSYVMLGDVTGHELVGTVSTHGQASAVFEIEDFANLNATDEIRIKGKTADGVMIKMIASADGSNGINVAGGIKHVVDGSTVYFLEGTTSDAATATVIVAAINAWGSANDNDLAAEIDGGDPNQVNVTMQKYKGVTGNNAGGGDNAADKPLTITAYRKNTIRGVDVMLPLDHAGEATERWFSTGNGVTDVSFVSFASGVTRATPFKDNSGTDTTFVVNGDAGAKFLVEGQKYGGTDIEISLKIGATTTTARKGLMLAWSMS